MHVWRDTSGVPIVAVWVNSAEPEIDWASSSPIGPVLVLGGKKYMPGSREMTCTGVTIDPEAPCPQGAGPRGALSH